MSPSAIPDTFRAYVAEKAKAADGSPTVRRGVREFASDDLPDGEVEIRVEWSSVNSRTGSRRGATARSPGSARSIPGIDLAGQVVSSTDPAFAPGDPVLVHGYELGVSRHGGYAEYQRVPAGWVVPLTGGLTPREAMAMARPGSRRRCRSLALEERGLRPGDGPVLVTGASGGVGSSAVAMLASAATRCGPRPARPTRRIGSGRWALPGSCRGTR